MSDAIQYHQKIDAILNHLDSSKPDDLELELIEEQLRKVVSAEHSEDVLGTDKYKMYVAHAMIEYYRGHEQRAETAMKKAVQVKGESFTFAEDFLAHISAERSRQGNEDAWGNNEVVERVTSFGHNIKKTWGNWEPNEAIPSSPATIPGSQEHSKTPQPGSVGTAGVGARQHSTAAPRHNSGTDAAAILDLLFALVGGAWRLLIGAALIIGVGFVIWGHLHPLNEHSSCSDFLQASPSAQSTLIQNMEAAHPSNDNNTTEWLVSVKLYCNLYPNNKVDGVYGDN